LLGVLFLIGAVAAAGLPPLSGFIGKVLMLQGSGQAPSVAWFWAAVLGSGLLATFALARAGSSVFWKTHGMATGVPMALGNRAGVALLAVAGTLLFVFAGDAARYSLASAQQLAQPRLYAGAVMSQTPVSPPGRTSP
jgi:multicomponent K+:H+ antiporter subunit D